MIEYTGFAADNDGKPQITEGLELGKQYYVVKEKSWKYILEDGKEVPFYETKAIDFVPAEKSPVLPINHKKYLNNLRFAFEFGNMSFIYDKMTNQTVFVSHEKNLTIVGRDNILDYIEETFKNNVENNIFLDVTSATVTKEDANGHKKGEAFLILSPNGKNAESAFLYDDGAFITKIELFAKLPSYHCEDIKLNARHNLIIK